VSSDTVPTEADVVVIGAGTAGATCAGLLAQLGSRRVVLLEAGPDYGSFAAGRWPADLLDARYIPLSHDWGLTSAPEHRLEALDHPRARVVGGCSAHNGCTAAPGPAIDYDRWGELCAGWDSASVTPLFELLIERFRVSTYGREELTVPQSAFVDAGVAAGLPYAVDLIESEAGIGIGPMPVNVVEGVRWNSAFAFLDPVRTRPELTVVGDASAQRVRIEDGRAVGVEFVSDGEARFLAADTVVVCGGAYGSPALLLRSGLGPAEELEALGIEVVADLPGVGRNLLDHPCAVMHFAGGPAFDPAPAEAEGWRPDEQSIGRDRSSLCDDGPYDIHVFMVAGANSGHPDLPPISMYGSAVRARSQGSVTLGPDGSTKIDHRYLSDPDGHDLKVLEEARELLGRMAAAGPLGAILGEPVMVSDDIPAEITSYCHPAGTCKMGLASDPWAVTGADGAVRGVEGLHVADASLMPEITRVNPNLPIAMIAARVSAHLLGIEPRDLARAARLEPAGPTAAVGRSG
jgi:choline dehydrogenase